MKQLSTFILLLLLGFAANAQLIYRYYTETRPGIFKDRIPKVIYQRLVTFYDEYAVKELTALHFDSTGLQTEKIEYDDSGKVTGRMVWHFEQPGRQLKYLAGNVWSAGKFSSDSALFHYDSKGFLNEVILKNDQNTLLRQAFITCDSIGNPIESNFYDNRGNLLSAEYARYLPERNKILIRQVKTDGSEPRTDSIDIDKRYAAKYAAAGETYNDRGDLIRSENYKPFKGKAVLEIFYRYDEFGNPAEISMFKVRGKGRMKRSEAHATIYRTYEY
ncbi:hypothetical protein HHL16_11090 [Pseudoflavitalea sp. G-6-1-2]|uniref:hypothetical protein n=1 Tax=Pseudoflavitalea sp. G-6-1-2 TaxID=2728841 RepID=UPI00146C3457|nr:hypothetical protein [Pseudoflavitalea sp. G-6-1-2]NML21423.1 hypothetical protein [Pseudoflavitalea sp. G-6-1-2]